MFVYFPKSEEEIEFRFFFHKTHTHTNTHTGAHRSVVILLQKKQFLQQFFSRFHSFDFILFLYSCIVHHHYRPFNSLYCVKISTNATRPHTHTHTHIFSTIIVFHIVSYTTESKKQQPLHSQFCRPRTINNFQLC